MTEGNANPAANPTGDNLTGHFLIAMPSLNDGFFNQAVTYICEHDESGSFGLIINQQTNIKLAQVLKEMKIKSGSSHNEDQSIFIGGPVDQGRGFILHRPTGSWSSSLTVKNDVTLTTSKDILQAIANNEGPEECIVTLGYAGWAAGQLEQEMASNTWLSCPADEQIIFNTPVEERWKAAAKLIGIDLSLLSNETGHA
jgi:putative transcriptional regulator